MDQHIAGFLNYYALDVNGAAVVEFKNWMLSLGGFPPILIFVYHI